MSVVRTCKLIVMLRRCTRTTGLSFIKMIFFHAKKNKVVQVKVRKVCE